MRVWCLGIIIIILLPEISSSEPLFWYNFKREKLDHPVKESAVREYRETRELGEVYKMSLTTSNFRIFYFSLGEVSSSFGQQGYFHWTKGRKGTVDFWNLENFGKGETEVLQKCLRNGVVRQCWKSERKKNVWRRENIFSVIADFFSRVDDLHSSHGRWTTDHSFDPFRKYYYFVRPKIIFKYDKINF